MDRNNIKTSSQSKDHHYHSDYVLILTWPEGYEKNMLKYIKVCKSNIKKKFL